MASVTISHVIGTVGLISLFITSGMSYSLYFADMKEQAGVAQLQGIADYISDVILDIYSIGSSSAGDQLLSKTLSLPFQVSQSSYNISLIQVYTPTSEIAFAVLVRLTYKPSIYVQSLLPWNGLDGKLSLFNGTVPQGFQSSSLLPETFVLSEISTPAVWYCKYGTKETFGLGVKHSYGTVRVTQNYNPSAYNLIGSTTYVSGSIGNLQSDNGVCMAFSSSSSAISAQTLYAHQETTSIGGTNYYGLLTSGADTSGLTLSASMSGSRTIFGKSVLSLQGVSSIPASTWTFYYRAWRDAATTVAFDAASSVEAATPATSASWSHTTGSGNNRLLVVSVSIHAATGTPTTVTGVTYVPCHLHK